MSFTATATDNTGRRRGLGRTPASSRPTFGGAPPQVNRGSFSFAFTGKQGRNAPPQGHRRLAIVSRLGALNCWDNGLCQDTSGAITYNPAAAAQQNAPPSSGTAATAPANATTATLPTHDQCTGAPPLPLSCFSGSGVAWTQAQTYARESANWNAGVQNSYQTAYDNWIQNGKKRWVNNQFIQTNEPPPPPPKQSSDPNVWYSVLTQKESSPYWSDPAYQGLNAQPYYMGGNITTTTGPNVIAQPGAGPVITQAPAYYSQEIAKAPPPTNVAPSSGITQGGPTAPKPLATAPPPSSAPAPAGTTNYTAPPAKSTVKVPTIPNVTPPSGQGSYFAPQNFSDTLQQSTSNVLPPAAADALPDWLGKLPIWQTGLALAALAYAFQQHNKGRR